MASILAKIDGASDGLGVCFFFLIIAVVAIVVVLVHVGWWSSFRQTLERVARHLGGRVVRGNWISGLDQVHFEHQGYSAQIRFSPRGKNAHYTHVEIFWSGPSFRCEVYPEGFLAGLRKLMGMQDILIGSPRFDREFIITGDDEPGIRALLNVQAQAAIVNLDSYVSGMYVRIGSQSLTVTSGSLIREFVRLVEFVKLCRELCDAAVAAGEHGIEFLDGASISTKPRTSAEARCMVCGETLVSDVVYCRTCKTPHHRECWSYSGGCSTYGCGEKKFATRNS